MKVTEFNAKPVVTSIYYNGGQIEIQHSDNIVEIKFEYATDDEVLGLFKQYVKPVKDADSYVQEIVDIIASNCGPGEVLQIAAFIDDSIDARMQRLKSALQKAVSDMEAFDRGECDHE